MNLFRQFVLLVSLTIVSIGSNAEVTVSDSWIRAVPSMMTTSSGYFRLNNNSQKTLLLTGVRVDFANKAEIHNHSMSNGLMTMGPADLPIHIEPGSSLEFKPKGLHIMLMGLEAALEHGAVYQIELLFDSHDPIRFSAKIAMDSTGH